MTDTWNNPTLSGHLIKDHERIVTALHSTATSKSKSVRKTQLPDPETLSAEVNTLQKSIDNISLKSFRFCFHHNNGDQLNDPQTGRRCRSVYAYIDEFGLQRPDQHREHVHVYSFTHRVLKYFYRNVRQIRTLWRCPLKASPLSLSMTKCLGDRAT